MPMPDHLQPECPPDAHKVMRPPEHEIKAQLVVVLTPSALRGGITHLASLLMAMSKTPYLLCPEQIKTQLEQECAGSECKPVFLIRQSPAQAALPDGTLARELVDLSADPQKSQDFLSLLEKEIYLGCDLRSMYILRSISTVYAWDALLAQHFLAQYHQAVKDLVAGDDDLLDEVRQGKLDTPTLKEKSQSAYALVRLERKLFLQYPTAEDYGQDH
ncbi:MAG: hypothetical protein IJ228_10455 [Succinivibrio sp.]|nr:hypothetical protein [Succinivibrio sp.]